MVARVQISGVQVLLVVLDLNFLKSNFASTLITPFPVYSQPAREEILRLKASVSPTVAFSKSSDVSSFSIGT